MRLAVFLLLLVPTLAAADPWQIGAGISVSRDGTDSASDGPNPSSFESSDFVLSYYGAVAEVSRVEGRLRYRLFGIGGKISSPISTSGWFVGVGGGVDLQVCRFTCFGIGLSASEQVLDYRRENNDEFHARFAALVAQASAYVAMPLADFSLTFRVGPRAKWIQNDNYNDEDDPQPGLGAELVLSGSL